MGLLDKLGSFLEDPTDQNWGKLKIEFSKQWKLARENIRYYATEPFAIIIDFFKGRDESATRATRHDLAIVAIEGIDSFEKGVDNVKQGVSSAYNKVKKSAEKVLENFANKEKPAIKNKGPKQKGRKGSEGKFASKVGIAQ